MNEVIWSGLICLVALLNFANSLRGEFVFDDLLVLEANRKARETGRGSSLRDLFRWLHGKRALVLWTFRLNMTKAKNPMNPFFWHLPSVIVHSLTSVAVFFILRHWFGLTASGLGALVYATHPLNSAIVPYISSRSSILSSAFHMFALLSFLTGGWYTATIPLWAYLGWKTKEEILNLIPLFLIIWLVG